MTRPAPRGPVPASAPLPRARRGPVLGVIAAAAALLAFAVGRWGGDRQVADRPPRADADVPASAEGGAPSRFTAAAPGQAAIPPAPWGAPDPAAPPPAPPARGEVLARATEELARTLETARPGLAERCVPPERRASGRSARVTFNVTFDATGREIARGISDDRRAPAPEVARCLRRLPLGALRVPAPGANVGVRVAMTLP